MEDWWLAAIPLIVACGWLFFPGAALLWVAGVRGTALLGLSPLLSASVLGCVTLVTGMLNVPFEVVSVLGIFLVLVAVTAIFRLVLRRPLVLQAGRERMSVSWLMLAGIGIAAILIAGRLMLAIGSPENISQTFDNVFHLNAVRYIMDTGDASPLTLSSLTHAFDGRGIFYPGLWHALTALVSLSSGVSIAVATNAVNIAIAAVVWPTMSLFLARQLFGSHAWVAVITGLLAGGFAQFPNLLLFFGVLYPNAYSIALLPGIIACTVLVFRRANEPTITWRFALLALVGSAPGLALSHPSSAIAFIVLAAPLAVAAAMSWLMWVRHEKPRPVTIAVHTTIGVVVLVVSVVAFIVARPAREAAFWTPTLSWGQGIESIVLSSEAFSAPTIPLSILLCVGVIALIMTKTQRWLVPSLGIILGLYLASVSLWVGTSRYLLTGTWYSDKYRLIALLPVVMLPIASFGIYWLGVQLARLVRVRSGTMFAPSDERRNRLHAVVGVALAAVFAALLQAGPALAASSSSLAARYSTTDESPLLSTDERALLGRVDSIVPKSNVVSGSPWTGASLVYAFSDRRALTPHIYGDRTPDDVAILDGLRDATPGSAVCDAVEELNAYYVLDFGEREVHGGSNTPAGFMDLADSDAVELRDSEGGARLYEVVGCTP